MYWCVASWISISARAAGVGAVGRVEDARSPGRAAARHHPRVVGERQDLAHDAPDPSEVRRRFRAMSRRASRGGERWNRVGTRSRLPRTRSPPRLPSKNDDPRALDVGRGEDVAAAAEASNGIGRGSVTVLVRPPREKRISRQPPSARDPDAVRGRQRDASDEHARRLLEAGFPIRRTAPFCDPEGRRCGRADHGHLRWKVGRSGASRRPGPRRPRMSRPRSHRSSAGTSPSLLARGARNAPGTGA